MTTELHWLTLSILLTALLWVPYILNRIMEGGFVETVMRDPEGHTATQVGWARRLMAAHGNAVENLVVFAALVLIAQAAGISTAQTQLAASLYFFSRLAHVVAFTLGHARHSAHSRLFRWLHCANDHGLQLAGLDWLRETQ